ncbi:hypothetical protein OG689_41630 [Kitasatospora sp. NBC_00240]|uniref:hypothetical protein n=1 Tax=Kitasatospora sp. NBC_00240 TaxID=2903567 RepID=UPI00224D7748|nr:hypothetical protein [Kitasatospora sp. NBC_00240]MCX5215659.1 hypothetical protein [Kitasatospora sp. NBC_00240]
MANVEVTIQELITGFPCSYSNRTQALHYLLVVGGNGYVWGGGEVVARHADSRTCLSVHTLSGRELKIVEAARRAGQDVPAGLLGMCPADALRPQAARLARTSGPLQGEAHPPSSGCLLLTVPPDTAPDWRAAAEEVAAVVRPLWESPAERWLALLAVLTDDQRAYHRRQRAGALATLDALGLTDGANPGKDR